MRRKEYIQVDRIPRKQRTVLTEQEKIAKIYALAEELKVQIGVEDAREDCKPSRR